MSVPRPIVFILSLLVIVFLTAGLADGQHNPDSQRLTATPFPTPPDQMAQWKPPPGIDQLPVNLISASSKLFEQGLADPRRCVYQEIQVRVGSVWGGAVAITTHGWVIPGTDQRFAVAWNGLVYPVISTGNPADLRGDISTIIKSDEEYRTTWTRERPDFPFYRFRTASPEHFSISHKSLLPLKAALLLRLGEVDLARQVWTAWTAGMRPGTNDDSLHLKDPYLMLASNWIWALFDRAVTSHMRGDDELALLSVRALVPIQKELQSEVERRGLLRGYYNFSNPKQQTPYLAFLKSVPALLADQERRAQSRQKTETPRLSLTVDLKNLPNRAARIAALIGKLDEVSARQSGQPGGVQLSEDKIIKAIIAEGEAAVEPLLGVLENDTRLTRSVHFWRDFSSHRSILGVHEAAYYALTEILKTSFFGVASTGDDLTARGMEGRRAVSAAIRKYWKEYGAVSIEERWYRILKDDHDSLDQWLQAASGLVDMTEAGKVAVSVPSDRQIKFPGRPWEVYVLRGEVLRQKVAPAVSQLLIRRMNEVLERKDENWQRTWRAATDFAMALAAWGGMAHVKDLQQITIQYQSLFATSTGAESERRPYLIGNIVSLYLKRQEIGNAAALAEYAEWLQTTKPEDAGDYGTSSLFEPATRNSSNPAIIAAINKMFSNPSSLWHPLIQKDHRQSFHAAKLVETPLLNVSGFREQILQGLTDKSVVGVLRPRATDAVNQLDFVPENTYGALVARGSNIGATTIRVRPDDERVARPLSEVSFRACDVFAWLLSGVEGAPEFEVYWRETARDAAIDALIKFLREHQGAFVYSQERF